MVFGKQKFVNKKTPQVKHGLKLVHYIPIHPKMYILCDQHGLLKKQKHFMRNGTIFNAFESHYMFWSISYHTPIPQIEMKIEN